MKLIPVILSGGAGTRLWPLSRELHPKQLLALTSNFTMLQETVRRVVDVPEIAAPIVICNESHRFMVAEQLRVLGTSADAIILEPSGRNTAPAIALAALAAAGRHDRGAMLLVLPADHVIADVPAFHAALGVARAAAATGKMVTFGVVPTRPETGFGYIRRGAPQESGYSIAEFVEKPDLRRATEFVSSGGYFWNSGMFMFDAASFLAELTEHAPDVIRHASAALKLAHTDLDFTRVDAAEFIKCPSISIDYALMEKTANSAVVPLDAGWSDVGSWSALRDALPADARGNVTHGDVLTEDTAGCYLHSESRLVAAVGLRDHVVVETKDAVLVAPKDRVQDVKLLVARLKASGRTEHSLHREVSRPWGSYDSIENGERFQVKRLVVKPGASLSLQLHHHRAEHWIVVSGTARITRNDEVFLLEENESTFIPLGARHRIENPGKIPLQIIEVQSGSYLGEDDIVRFQDHYGRDSASK